jgi:hypothetical protein
MKTVLEYHRTLVPQTALRGDSRRHAPGTPLSRPRVGRGRLPDGQASGVDRKWVRRI